MALSIGVDVGGTKIAAGVVDEEGAVLERIQRASPANDRASILDTIVDCALELKESRPEAVAVGIGAAGFVSSDRNTMASGTNLDWTGVRIGDVVAERYGTAPADSGRRRRIEGDLDLVTAVMSATASPGRRLLARIVPKSMVGGRFTEA